MFQTTNQMYIGQLKNQAGFATLPIEVIPVLAHAPDLFGKLRWPGQDEDHGEGLGLKIKTPKRYTIIYIHVIAINR